MKYKWLLFIFLSFSSLQGMAQNMNWSTVNSGGKTIDIYSNRKISIDPSGNKYVTAHFKDSMTVENTTLYSAREGVCLLVYNSRDSLIRAKTLWECEKGVSQYTIWSQALDNASNLIFCINFEDSILVNNIMYHSKGSYDMLFLKTDSLGNQIYCKHWGSPCIEQINLMSVTFDHDNNAIVTGGNGFPPIGFTDTCHLQIDTLTLSTVNGKIFILKFDSLGNLIKSKTFGGTGSAGGAAIRFLNGRYYLFGGFSSQIGVLDNVTINFPSNLNYKNFIAQLDEDFNAVWARYFGTNNFPILSRGFDVKCNQITLTGYSNDVNGFQFQSGAILIGKGNWDFFVAAYDSNGNYKWGKVSQSYSSEHITDLVVDQKMNSYITGSFQASLILDNDTLHSNGIEDAFVLCLDSLGNEKWALNAGGNGVNSGNGIAIDGDSSVYVVGGTTSDPCYFGNSTHSANSLPAIFVAKIENTPLSNTEFVLQKKLTLYPNPNSGNFTLQCDAHTPQYITVYSMLGECVFSATTNSHPTSIPIQLPPLPDGLYILKASSEDGNFTQTFLVKTP